MTAVELARLVGTRVALEPAPGLEIYCLVLDAKTAYGRRRVQVAPVAGRGTAWVDVESTSPRPLKGAQQQ